MNDWKLPWEAGCRCGRVRVRVSAPPLITSACHCTGCQRMTGSAYSLTLTLPATGLTVTAGEPVLGGLHGETKHYHCPHCMSWVFTRPEGMADQFVNLRATTLDDASWFVPYVETYTEEKLPWASTPARHSYARVPDVSEYMTLTQEFSEHGARPK